MKRVLFICSRNRLRSPTAEQVFADYPGIEVSSAGLDNDADTPVTSEVLQWAELIFVMERKHRSRLQLRFRSDLNGKRVICLGIPDKYRFMQLELVELLKEKVLPHLPHAP